MSIHLRIVWVPTLRCNLMCSYCVARTMPVETHGAEAPAQLWREAFAACPRDKVSITASGREASLYSGIAPVLEALTWPVRFESNNERPITTWLTPAIAARVDEAMITCHWLPGSRGWENWWTNAAEVRAMMPDVKLGAAFLALVRDPLGAIQEFVERAAAAGFTPQIGSFDENLLWRERRREYGPAPACLHGADQVILLPDGTAFRCLGHSYYGVAPMGNLLTDGWGILSTDSLPCEVTCCCGCDCGITIPTDRSE